MNKLIIALGLALVSSTAAFADSGALDVVDHAPTYTASGVDYAATASIGSTAGEVLYDNRAKLGDGSPMIGAEPTAPVAIETGYLTNDRLGGNS